MQNGYELMDWAAEDIAIDLHEYDAQFEKLLPMALVPYVQNWKGAQEVLRSTTAWVESAKGYKDCIHRFKKVERKK